MPERSDVVYLYDGSFEGLLCCIFESYDKKELPFDIKPEGSEQTTLFRSKVVDTDIAKSDRVKKGIINKASFEVFRQTELCYYTCHTEKEILILDYVRLAMKMGRKVLSALTDETVSELHGAVFAMERESHLLKGFVRFKIHDNVMSAIIEPKNFVLPLLAPHFCDRYSNECFVIYDKAHSAALIYKPYEYKIIYVEDFEQPETDEDEFKFSSLWKLFYNTIGIEERYNPKCRMNLMPKRFWKHMTEMQDLEKNKIKLLN